MRMRRSALAVVLVASVVALAGCAALPSLPGPSPTGFVPTGTATSATTQGHLSPDGFDAARRIAVRIRNVGCDSLSTGSGFAIDATTLITNRHVVANAAAIQISTYDGRDIAATAATTAALADLAIVRTAAALPAFPDLADRDPVRGDTISVVGYPLGGELTVTTGKVIGETTDPLHANLGEVLVTDAQVEPGSSGSAVLDSSGRVVGVVYAKNAGNQSYVVPVSTLKKLLADSSSFSTAPACR
jgi:S1-C subfamily serine protease